MSKGDELDTLLSDPSVIDTEWEAFGSILSIMNILERPLEIRREIVNRKIRHYYGHMVVNVFRDSYEPDYVDPILINAAKKLNIDGINQSAEDLEDGILQKIICSFQNEDQTTEKTEKNDDYAALLAFCKNRDGIYKEKWLIVLGKILGPVVGGGPSLWLYFFGDTKWRRVLPAIVLTAMIRKRIALEEALVR